MLFCDAHIEMKLIYRADAVNMGMIKIYPGQLSMLIEEVKLIASRFHHEVKESKEAEIKKAIDILIHNKALHEKYSTKYDGNCYICNKTPNGGISYMIDNKKYFLCYGCSKYAHTKFEESEFINKEK